MSLLCLLEEKEIQRGKAVFKSCSAVSVTTPDSIWFVFLILLNCEVALLMPLNTRPGPPNFHLAMSLQSCLILDCVLHLHVHYVHSKS